jgi:hypothetical protein
LGIIGICGSVGGGGIFNTDEKIVSNILVETLGNTSG